MGSELETSLSVQLEATRVAVKELAEAVDDLAHRDRMRVIILTIIGVVVAGLIGLTVYTISHFSETNRRLENLTNNAFLFSCESANEGRQALREDNIADAEALILVTNSDVQRPEVAEEYRRVTRENTEKIKDRDCEAELRKLSG